MASTPGSSLSLKAYEYATRAELSLSPGRRSGVQPGYAGISIEMESGEVVTAWAVQKANWSRWQSRRTRADEVAEFLREHARAVD